MMGGTLGHTTSHAGHEPRIAVSVFIDLIVGSESVIRLDGMFDIMASRQCLDSQNVVEVETLVTRNGR